MKRIKVQAYNFKEANEIICYLLRNGYEGVQNDSYRYCDIMAKSALNKGKCFICVCCVEGSSMRISNTHDKEHRKYKEVSKSKFLSLVKMENIKEKFVNRIYGVYDRVNWVTTPGVNNEYRINLQNEISMVISINNTVTLKVSVGGHTYTVKESEFPLLRRMYCSIAKNQSEREEENFFNIAYGKLDNVLNSLSL